MNSLKIIFVYAGDSGTINTLFHIAHKIVSPITYPCNLCGLIYNVVTEKKEWTRFKEQLNHPLEFLHRDEFSRKYPHQTSKLPAIFIEKEGALVKLVEANEINVCKTTIELIQLIQENLSKFKNGK